MKNRNDLKDEVWLNVATEVARLSRDENTHVGAVIIKENGSLLSTGYNGSVKGTDDSRIPHSRELKPLSFIANGEEINFECNKYPFMEHAEKNAIDYCTIPDELKGATIYVTHKPCPACAWNIVKHGIKRVVIAEDDGLPHTSVCKDFNLSLYMFAQGGITVLDGKKLINLSANHPIWFANEETNKN